MHTQRVLLTLGLFTLGCGVAPGDEGDEIAEVAEVAEVAQHAAPADGASSPTLWVPFPGLSGITQIETARNADGSLALFAQASGGIQFTKQAAPNTAWYGAVSLDGGVSRDFAVALGTEGRLELYALGGPSGAIYRQAQAAPNAIAWGGWHLIGGSGFTDLAVGRHADGRLALFTVAADGTLRVRHQTGPGGAFGPEINEGGALTRVEVGTTGTGRMIAFAISTVGSVYVKEQAAPNGAFGAWIPFGGTQIVDIDVGVDQDGRLELVAGLSGGYSYKRSQAAPDGAWSGWYYLGGQGLGDLDTVLAPDGRLHLFAISNARAHHLHQTSPGADAWTWAPEMGGTGLQALRAERNEDGRLELFGLTAGGEVLQTWETLGGGWLPLPPLPAITPFTVSTTTPPLDGTVRWEWGVVGAPGCAPTGKLAIRTLEGATTYENAIYGSTVGTVWVAAVGDRRLELTVTCREHVTSGFPAESVATILIDPVEPPPPTPPPPPPPMRVQAPTYQIWLGADIVYSGARSHSAYWGHAINGGQLTSLVNPNLYYISLIRPTASNNDCWGPSSVVLAPSQATTTAELTRLYGTSTPALPAWIRGCANIDTGGILPVNVNYSYLR